MQRRVTILGSTGSIGTAALEVVEGLREECAIVALGAGSNWEKLAEQARRHRPSAVAIAEESAGSELRRAVPPGTRVFAGPDALTELVRSVETDFVLSAVVGAAGLPATLAAVERGLTVGLANKESLVVAGALLMPLARERGATLLPVDSEHSGVFQLLQCGRVRDVQRIYLTASGGPFRTWTRERIEQATLADALNHPIWSMGPKITIDSATMMNKALEIIEAAHLFEASAERIEVLVHPQSLVHALIEFVDGSLLAQVGSPDMRTPIQYALTYPQRVSGLAPRLDLGEIRRLDFEPPDLERFPALALGYEAARLGGSAGAVLNAANEEAVARFRGGRVGFAAIARICAEVLRRHEVNPRPSLAQLLAADRWARSEVDACLPR